MREDYGTEGLGYWLAYAGMGFGELVAFCPNYFDDALELFRKIARKPTDEIGQDDDVAIADVERMLSETVAAMHSDDLEKRFRAGFLEMNASLLGEKPRKIFSVAEATELIIEMCRFIRGVRPQATQLERELLGARNALAMRAWRVPLLLFRISPTYFSLALTTPSCCFCSEILPRMEKPLAGGSATMTPKSSCLDGFGAHRASALAPNCLGTMLGH
ncbi:hypothetical protein [Rhizobium sp. Nf11,1]|uniref:hypothetical protein n=1 Tax=Rhizobium sp. Nf11,1 TaxID=3404923 RepID=UPI003D351D1B